MPYCFPLFKARVSTLNIRSYNGREAFKCTTNGGAYVVNGTFNGTQNNAPAAPVYPPSSQGNRDDRGQPGYAPSHFEGPPQESPEADVAAGHPDPTRPADTSAPTGTVQQPGPSSNGTGRRLSAPRKASRTRTRAEQKTL
ncbi:hypothetical protein FA13DRAFT_1789737 [Coprinellus micaceus]|uniref:Uncharacterized protein n=1 Tax=Coprinellus micaceus TaxID=71717 RepID=A0A4Y7TKA6_COPMI|nr:hypothetical protein FA13DRAFT_1789737 [Coprinellus micaceus]